MNFIAPKPAAPASLYVDQPSKPQVVKKNLVKALYLFQGVMLSLVEYKQAIANL